MKNLEQVWRWVQSHAIANINIIRAHPLRALANIPIILAAVIITAVVGTTLSWVLLVMWLCGDSVEKRRAVLWPALQKLWARPILNIASIQYRGEGLERLRYEHGVLCFNHASVLDILLIIAVLPSPGAVFTYKRELINVPPVGWLGRLTGQIPVDRHNGHRARQELDSVPDRPGTHIIFFVEGTRTRTGALLPFKKGAFHEALKRRMPLIPIALVNTHSVLPPGPFLTLQPGEVYLRVGEGLSTEGLTSDDLPAMMGVVRERLEDVL